MWERTARPKVGKSSRTEEAGRCFLVGFAFDRCRTEVTPTPHLKLRQKTGHNYRRYIGQRLVNSSENA